MAAVSAPEFWTDLFARGGDSWDLRQPSPPLVEFLHRPRSVRLWQGQEWTVLFRRTGAWA